MTVENKEIVLPVRAKHYLNSFYLNDCKCSLANAAKDFFNTENVSELVNEIIVNGINYLHERYRWSHYEREKEIAANNKYDETVIREIVLKPKVISTSPILN